MKEVNNLSKLLGKQKAYQKGLLILTKKIFDNQNQILNILTNKIGEIQVREPNLSMLLTSKEICDELKISQSTLYRMRVEDGFPYTKIKGRKNIMFNRKDIEEYLSNKNNRKS